MFYKSDIKEMNSNSDIIEAENIGYEYGDFDE